MEIKTKYNIGDTRWLMRDNKAVEMFIIAIDAEVKCDKEGTAKAPYIGYRLARSGDSIVLYESAIVQFSDIDIVSYATKQELLNSL